MSVYTKEYYEDGTISGYRNYSWKRLGCYFQATAKHIVDNFHPTRILDCGCAKGFLVKSLRDLGVRAEGFDISEYAVSQAIVPVLLADIEGALPYPDQSFDVVTCLDVLEHLGHPGKAIANLRSLSSNWILINVWTAEAPDGLDVTHKRPPKSRDEWIRMLADEDWEPLDVSPYLSGVWWFNQPETLIVMRRRER